MSLQQSKQQLEALLSTLQTSLSETEAKIFGKVQNQKVLKEIEALIDETNEALANIDKSEEGAWSERIGVDQGVIDNLEQKVQRILSLNLDEDFNIKSSQNLLEELQNADLLEVLSALKATAKSLVSQQDNIPFKSSLKKMSKALDNIKEVSQKMLDGEDVEDFPSLQNLKTEDIETVNAASVLLRTEASEYKEAYKNLLKLQSDAFSSNFLHAQYARFYTKGRLNAETNGIHELAEAEDAEEANKNFIKASHRAGVDFAIENMQEVVSRMAGIYLAQNRLLWSEVQALSSRVDNLVEDFEALQADAKSGAEV